MPERANFVRQFCAIYVRRPHNYPETDNVRQAYRAERDALAGRVSFLEEELKTARVATEAYRRARGS